MTWFLVRDTGDVYDHEESIVDTIDKPYRLRDDVYDVMRDAMSDNQPSAYNQGLIADAAMNQIEAVETEDDLPFDTS